MIRKEEILNAAREYNNGITLSSPSNVLHFEAGAKWADKHPDLSQLWHDASEEPDKDMLILFKDKYGYSIITWVNCNNCNWAMYVGSSSVQKWAYIKDLLPKGGEG